MEEEFDISIKDFKSMRKQILDKVLVVKSELMMAFFERAKNSQSFFRNLIESIEGAINDIQDEGLGMGLMGDNES